MAALLPIHACQPPPHLSHSETLSSARPVVLHIDVSLFEAEEEEEEETVAHCKLHSGRENSALSRFLIALIPAS